MESAMNETQAYPYATYLDVRFPALSVGAQQGFVVPKGVVHRTRAPERAIILLVETAAIIPTGDA
jgi:hypothetical protein